ncbi:MAG: GntR family transcriptional regulator [Spirochaetia bacterium]|nr:GntR family transcriptional regulator [Spirochaetia bacterium]
MARANDIAYEYIKKRIINGHFRPAQRLVEAQLAVDIPVSRNTVHKALLQLEQERLIVMEANKGATVLSLDVEEIQEYYEIRKSLEVIVVSSATSLISEAALAKLHDILLKMKELSAHQNYDEYSKCNVEFHNIIYGSSKKPVAVEMIKMIKNQLIRFQFRTMMVPGRSDSSLQEHEALFEAINNRDKEAAAIAISHHMDNVSKTIEKYKELYI